VPTSSVLKLGTNTDKNQSTITYIAYCFHSVDGYSKVGTYEGNGDADGTFVYTGFRPAWVMYKRTDVANDWHIKDSERASYNGMDIFLQANSAGAEQDSDAHQADFLSNGFKARNPYAEGNADGGTYIYLAFAETPFKYSNAR
ncbi:MAG: hypothetical protein QF535_04355, partial [Anaerolineales bacterium]|nr:hypothetical protein [Anaerolineales bacterium]